MVRKKLTLVRQTVTQTKGKLREEVINDLYSAWEEQVQENLRQGLQNDDAEVQASNRLLPVYRRKL